MGHAPNADLQRPGAVATLLSALGAEDLRAGIGSPRARRLRIASEGEFQPSRTGQNPAGINDLRQDAIYQVRHDVARPSRVATSWSLLRQNRSPAACRREKEP